MLFVDVEQRIDAQIDGGRTLAFEMQFHVDCDLTLATMFYFRDILHHPCVGAVEYILRLPVDDLGALLFQHA